ncbi:Schizosaccharomyces specific protein Mug15 [Schizosaccharomyces osmophilus]|uniref:Schizosaccharomyces specific protein Mug15 n=1 Tax=Schizosaccharomyces osmophilus TaxID=2545709 RepID=A0AAE9W7D2_9SCHI|nr:Schizosaccharomyces specific protein Mug15 [Schizosaccharomyces osmophilus]WBW71189.1 Schizosaccharomyces specific protein Mug15 [Schizosaccharomyces osmophilus]
MQRDTNAEIEKISNNIHQLAGKQQVDSVYLLRLENASLLNIPQPERSDVKNSSKKSLNFWQEERKDLVESVESKEKQNSVVPQSLPDFVRFVCNVIQCCKSYSSLGSFKLIRVTYEASQLLIIHDSTYAIAVIKSEPDK